VSRTGQVSGFEPKGRPTWRPSPSWWVLRATQLNDDQAVATKGDVGDVERHQLAAAERAAKPTSSSARSRTPITR